MATVGIVWRRIKNTDEGYVNLRFTANRESRYISLEEKVLKKHFKPNGSNYLTRQAPFSSRLNALFLKKHQEAKHILIRYKENGRVINFGQFKNDFLPKKDISLFKLGMDFYQGQLDKENIEKSSFELYGYALKCFKKFAKTDITVGALNNLLVQRYRDFLEAKYKNATAFLYFNVLMWVYASAQKKQYPNQNAFLDIQGFKEKSEEKESRKSLDLDEFERLKASYKAYLLDGSMQKGLRKAHYNVLRQFIFACYTGLRGSDTRFLTPEHLTEKTIHGIGKRYFIEKTMQKGKKKNTIPLLEAAVEMIDLKQEEGFLFYHYCEDHYLVLLKDIDAAFNINKKMSPHTARHTFSTLSITFGLRREVLQELLGHSTERMTTIYAKIKKKLVVKDLELAWDNMKKVKYSENILSKSDLIRYNIRVIRKLKEDTYIDAAKKIGVDGISSSQFFRFESGENELKVNFLFSFCEAYNVDLFELFEKQF